MKKKILITLLSLACAFSCAFSLAACNMFGGNEGGTTNEGTTGGNEGDGNEGGNKGDNEGDDNKKEEDTSIVFELNADGNGYKVATVKTDATNVVIPDTYKGKPVTEIGSNSFSRCDLVTSITVGKNVSKISGSAFTFYAGKLATVNYENGMANWCKIEGLTYLMEKNSTDRKLVIDGKEISGKFTIPEDITSISRGAFIYCGITEIIIPESMPEINNGAFSGNPVETAKVPAEACAYVARDNPQLKTIEIYSGEEISSYAFRDCKSLTNVTIGKSVTKINENSFSDCVAITTINYTGDMASWCKIEGLLNLLKVSENDERKLVIDGKEITGELTFPENVTEIADFAFYNCKTITGVTVHGGVTKIGKGAFSMCSNIASLTIPFVGKTMDGKEDNHFGHIFNCTPDRHAFIVPTALKTVTITGGTNIGSFQGCESIKSITLPDSVTTISSGAFSYALSITEINLGTGLKTIGENAFVGCFKISEIQYKGKIESWCAIEGLNSLMKSGYMNKKIIIDGEELTGEVTIPTGVEKIADYAFYYRTDITKVNLGEVKSIGSYAFTNCTGLTGDLVIPDGATDVGTYAFYTCSNVSTLTLPASFESAGEQAFNNCDNITKIYFKGDMAGWCEIEGLNAIMCAGYKSKELIIDGAKIAGSLTIPEGITAIGDYAFHNYASITGTLSIPASVTYIGKNAFKDCKHDTVNYTGDLESWCAIEGLANVVVGKKVLMNGNELTGEITVPEGVTKIADYAFYNRQSVTAITLPVSVTSIGDYAFSYSALTEISIPASVKTIGKNAFAECSKLASVALSEGLEVIDDWAFASCRLITEITLPESLTTIGESAFNRCAALKTVTIPDGVTTLGKNAFVFCSALTHVKIGDGVTKIGAGAFSQCTKLNTVAYGANVDTIGDNAFEYCTALTSISIPDSVTTIGKEAFRVCTGAVSVTIGTGSKELYSYAFYGCNRISMIQYSGTVASWCDINGLSAIMQYGYEKGKTLIIDGTKVEGTIVIPEGVKSINSYAFYKCADVTGAVIPQSVKKINNYAFYGCDSTMAIYYQGTSSDWSKVSRSSNAMSSTVTVFYYSETQPASKGDYWHFDIDEVTPVIWNKEN